MCSGIEADGVIANELLYGRDSPVLLFVIK
jgi:hypothetical protein